jgi:hypothetical protein
LFVEGKLVARVVIAAKQPRCASLAVPSILARPAGNTGSQTSRTACYEGIKNEKTALMTQTPQPL